MTSSNGLFDMAVILVPSNPSDLTRGVCAMFVVREGMYLISFDEVVFEG